ICRLPPRTRRDARIAHLRRIPRGPSRPPERRHQPATDGNEAMSGLVARTRRLDRDADHLAVAGADGFLFSRNRVGFAGRGVAARAPRDEIADLLADIE